MGGHSLGAEQLAALHWRLLAKGQRSVPGPGNPLGQSLGCALCPKSAARVQATLVWGANLQVACANREDDLCSGGQWRR
jgi:hypothetical protein